MKKNDFKKEKEALQKGTNKAKGFINAFRAFIQRGNVMDLAVGVIIGAAFQNIVTSLTNSFIKPLIAVVTGGSQDGVVIGGTFVIRGVTFDYGSFITAVVNFLIMAIVLFSIIRAMNSLNDLTNKNKDKNEDKKVEKPSDIVLLEEIRDILKNK